jgi:hypothetical protein
MGHFHCEPPLSQMLEDPLTRLLMQSDGVDPRRLRDLLDEAKQRIADTRAPRGENPFGRCRE